MNEIVILKGRADATQLGAHAPYKHVPRHPVAQFFILETRNEWKTYQDFFLLENRCHGAQWVETV